MKRYPLQQLLQLRAHRSQAARRLVSEQQGIVRECEAACARIESEIVEWQRQRADQRHRLLDAPPPGTDWAVEMAQRAAHVDWLALQELAAKQRLVGAQEDLKAAELALAQARTAYLRAQAREDALAKRKDVWRGEEHALEVRNEESASADLLMSRNATSKMH